MNKNAIKKFAIEARKKLIASISDRAGMLGITPEGCSEPISKGIDFEVYKTVAGTEVTLGRTQCEQRRKLKEQIEARGFEAVVEEVAYTWFNRICAIRFMEVNDYLPTRVRVLSSEKEGKNEPDIVTQSPDVDLDFTDKEREYILDCKMNNKLDELFKMLVIKQCNKLSEILPELFEATEDYTEMLLNISYTNKDDIIHMLVNQETGIPEADFNVSTIGEDGQPTGQVEIIGWLYQYYNTELKDDTFAQLKKNVKISKERIPAATQLFTPDWIVRYMVENSVGRLWIEHLRAVDPSISERDTAEKFGWKYYLPEAEQEADVNIKLVEIRTSYKDLKPEDITCIDPCMGSGHILVAMFDVLMDIYKSAGYSERDAAFEIVEHNIHGLDIDKRAYQLAYFAVMMKGRGYNRRFFRCRENVPALNVCAVIEAKGINKKHLDYFGFCLSEDKRKKAISDIRELIDLFFEAREIGSLINVPEYDWKLLREYAESYYELGQISFDTVGIDETQKSIIGLIKEAEILSKKYFSVVTNPPYMGNNGMNQHLGGFIKDKYAPYKGDLFAVFMKRANEMLSGRGISGLVTMQSWMFLSSFEQLRKDILTENSIVTVMHMNENVMGIAFGTAVSILRKRHIDEYKGVFHKVEYEYLNEYGAPNTFPVPELPYKYVSAERFEKIPNMPIAYWISEAMLKNFEKGESIEKYVDTFQGIITGNNDKFLRMWTEIDYTKMARDQHNMETVDLSKTYWIPYNKGGDFRKWYGIQDYVVYWKNGPDDKTRGKKGFSRYYLRDYVAWSYTVHDAIATRYYPHGFLWDVRGSGLMDKSDMNLYLEALISSKVGVELFHVNNSTISCQVENILQLPILFDASKKDAIDAVVMENNKLAKEDWDAFEISWNFQYHPFMANYFSEGIRCGLLSDAYKKWESECESRFSRVKNNEEVLNRYFIEIYGLQDELDYHVSDKDITMCKADRSREVRSFLSYIIGCKLGRYSLDKPGLIFAGGEWNSDCYTEYESESSNCIPITDEQYFSVDVVEIVIEFLKKAFGDEYLEENLDFIAENLASLDSKSARQIIREYFVQKFYDDHVKIYQKKPIYWMFDSGVNNGFKALIYMHRNNADMVGTVRIDYLHKAQRFIENAKDSAQYLFENASSSNDKSQATKLIDKYVKQLAEIQIYDEALSHMASKRISFDLDSGVKANYALYQNVCLEQEGKKNLQINLLAEI